MTALEKHIFNASYLAIFLYGTRRIIRKIRPISFDDAYSYLRNLPKKPGEKIFLIHRDGTLYHVANAPAAKANEVVGAFAQFMRGLNTWNRVVWGDQYGKNHRIVWNTPITSLLPPEAHNRIPKMAQGIKKAIGGDL